MQKRKNSIDLMKFIMAMVVIAIHTQPLVNCTDFRINSIYNTVTAMAVPFFFIVSGYLLAKKCAFPYSSQDISKMMTYLNRIVKMYLIWTVIYTPIAIWHYISNQNTISYAILAYIRGLDFLGLLSR